MAADVAQTKLPRHMGAYENDTCHTQVHVHACVSASVCACVHLCVCVCVCVIKEKAPFFRILLSP